MLQRLLFRAPVLCSSVLVFLRRMCRQPGMLTSLSQGMITPCKLPSFKIDTYLEINNMLTFHPPRPTPSSGAEKVSAAPVRKGRSKDWSTRTIQMLRSGALGILPGRADRRMMICHIRSRVMKVTMDASLVQKSLRERVTIVRYIRATTAVFTCDLAVLLMVATVYSCSCSKATKETAGATSSYSCCCISGQIQTLPRYNIILKSSTALLLPFPLIHNPPRTYLSVYSVLYFYFQLTMTKKIIIERFKNVKLLHTERKSIVDACGNRTKEKTNNGGDGPKTRIPRHQRRCKQKQRIIKQRKNIFLESPPFNHLRFHKLLPPSHHLHSTPQLPLPTSPISTSAPPLPPPHR